MASYAHGACQTCYHSQQQQYHQHQPRWSLNDLSTELLALIFEQLRDIDTQYVSTARLLCRRFNQIAVPIAYNTLVLTERIVAQDAGLHFPQALEHISAHTNHVVARSDLDPAGIKRILERIRRLCSVRWRYVDREVRSGRFWLPSDILNAEQTRYNRTKLYVEELPLRDFEGEMRNTYLRAIPIDLLVSLKMAHPAPPLVTRLNSLKHLLLSARQLETLHFEDRGQGTQFDFAPHERLPPLRELTLRSYDWRHSAEEVSRHWDFSRITSLELISVPVFNFLNSVNFHELANLQTLHCEDFSAHLPDLRIEATRRLNLLVRSYIRALSTLQITVHTYHFPVDALLSHARTLTTLRLRDHTGFGEEDRRCPTVYHEDLAMLAAHMRQVQVLELDMDVVHTDPPQFLRAVCAFPALHTLTLHVQTVLHPFEVVHPGSDRDRDASMRTLQFLVRHKAGSVPWRSITINVGGWKKVMVRRLSEPWRRQNERGVFAERCFVLERNAGTGEMSVREEVAVEASRQATPEEEEDEEEEEDDDDEDEEMSSDDD